MSARAIRSQLELTGNVTRVVELKLNSGAFGNDSPSNCSICPDPNTASLEGSRRCPGHLGLARNHSHFYLRQGDHRRAAAVLRDFLRANPGDAAAKQAIRDLATAASPRPPAP